MPKQEAPDRDLIEGHLRYRKLNDLNEGTFGVVMLALDTVTNDRVSLMVPTLACTSTLQAVSTKAAIDRHDDALTMQITTAHI